MASNGTSVENIAEVGQNGKAKEVGVGDEVVGKPAVKDIKVAGDKEETPVSVGDLLTECDEKPGEAEVEFVGVVPAKATADKTDADAQGNAVDGKEENGATDKKEEVKDEATSQSKEAEEEQNPLKRKSEGIEEVPAAKIAVLEENEKEANGGAEVEATNGNA
jgi:hypothetical protein